MVHSKPIISLPHLTNEIVRGARKTKLCSYAVAVEGWRRGLKLKWYTIDSGKFDDMVTFGVNPPGRLFSLESDERIHYFFRTRGDKVSNQAVEIGSDKEETKYWMNRAGVPVPSGGKFTNDDPDEAIVEFSNQLTYPLVLKPTDGSLGLGVVTNIKTEEQLRKAINYVRHQLAYENIMVERYVPGEEYRVYVVDGKVIAAYNRLPANVIGDGTHTIRELIDMKNADRKKNARLHSCLIELDEETLDFVQEAGYNLDDVIPSGKKLLLKEKSNVSAGGDPIDVTDEIPEEMKQLAIRAIEAVPGLYHGGVDIIVDIEKPILESAVVIELNPTAQIGGILFPMQGKARDIPAAIVDYYFPETEGIKTEKEKLYFDLNAVLEPLQNRSSQEVTVAPAIVGDIYLRAFEIKGKVTGARFQRMIKEKALDLGLSGAIKIIDHNKIRVTMASPSLTIIEQLKSYIVSSLDTSIKRLDVLKWNEPIKVGFFMDDSVDLGRLRNISAILKRTEKDYKRLIKEKYELEKRTRYIKESTSWKVTEKMRLFRRKYSKETDSI